MVRSPKAVLSRSLMASMSFLLAVSGLAAVSAPSAQAWTASSGWAAVGSKWSRDALFISDQVTAIPDMASKTSVSSSDRVTITTSLPVAVDDNLAVGPSTSPDHSGELALYGWTAASREIHRYDAATTPGASEDGSLGNLPSPGWTGATWGGEINQKTGQLYITSEYTDYIECSATNNSTNGGTIDLAIYNLGATSATLASTTGGTSPKPKTTSVCVMEQQRNGNSVTRWLVASDMAIDAEGNFYILLVSNSTPYVYYLVRVEPPRNNDGSLASSGTWLYTPVVRLTFNLGQPGSDLWGMAFMNGSLFLGDDEGHIFKVNTLTGDGVNLGDSGPLVRDFAAAQLAPMVRGKLNIDVDGDGQISAAEESAPGLANQTVGIYRQSDNAKLGELKTDDNGEYFGLLPSASDDLYIRVIQPQYNGVNVHQVKGYYWKGDDSLVTTLGQSHNEVKPMCYSASADGVKLSATGDCLGAKRSGIDPTTTSSVGSDANFISSVEMNQDLEVAVADFGFSANGSWGDAAAATKSTGADSGPNFANNSVRGVQLGDELGSYADGVNDANSAAHDADDGVSVRLVHDVDVPLQGQILSQGRNYPIHITGSKTDGVSGDIKVSGWASPVNAASPAGTTISSTATPWLSATLGSDGTYTTPTSAAYQAPTSPAVGFAKGVMRFQASTTAQTAPDNSGRAYAPAQGAADANTKAWVAPGEVEDYQVVYASAQLRVAAKTTAGSLTNHAYQVTNVVGTAPSSTSGSLTTSGSDVFVDSTPHAIDSLSAATKITLNDLPSGYDLESVECYDSLSGVQLPSSDLTYSLVGNKPTATVAAGYFDSSNAINDLTCQFNIDKSVDADKSTLTLADTYTDGGSTTSDGKTGVGTYIEATVTAKGADGTVLPGKVVYFTVPGGSDVTVKNASDTTLTAVDGYYTCTTGSDGTCKVKLSSTKAAVYSNGLHAGIKIPSSAATPTEVSGSPATIEWVAGGCDAGTSYFDIDKTTTPAGSGATDGATFTVTLLDASHNACTPQSGALTITKQSGSATVGTPQATGTQGVYTVTVKDDVAETVNFAVKLGSQDVPVSAQSGHVATANPQPVTFTALEPNQTKSTVTIAPTAGAGATVLANNSDTYTITATVQDSLGNPLARTVTFAVASGTATLNGTTCTTSASGANAGTCTVTVRSNTVGTATVSASIPEFALTGSPVSAAFSASGVSAQQSTLAVTEGNGDATKAAGPIEAGQAYTVVATVADDQGHALPGKTVNFYQGDSTTPVSGTYTTGADGKVVFSWTETVADDPATSGVNEGSHQLHAKVEVNGSWVEITGSHTPPDSPVTRVWTANSTADAAHSYLQIDGGPSSDAVSVDGGSHTVKVTVADQYGNLITGAPVTFECSGSNCSALNFAAISGNTSGGSYSTTVTSATTGDYNVKAKFGNVGASAITAVANIGSAATPPVLSAGDTVVAKFSAGGISASASELAVTPGGPLTVGTAAENTYTATVTAYDGQGLANGGKGNLVGGQTIKFEVYQVVNGAEVAVDTAKTKFASATCPTASSGADLGKCSVTLTSTMAGVFRIKALTSANVEIGTADREYTAGTIDASKSSFDVLPRNNDPVVSDITGTPSPADLNWWIVRVAAMDANGNHIEDLAAIQANMEFTNVASQNSGVYFTDIQKVPANVDPDGAGPAVAVSYPTYIAYARTQKAGEWSLGAQTKAGVQIGSFIPKRWVPGAVDPNRVSYVLSDDPVPADGSSTQTATITVRDGFGNPIAGHGVRITNVTSGDDSPSKLVMSAAGEGATSNETGHVGEYVFTLSSSAARAYDIRGWVRNAAGDDWVSIPLTTYTTANPQTTHFVAGGCVAASSILSVDKDTTQVGSNIAVTVTLLDENGNACVGGKPELVFGSGSHATASEVTGSGNVWTATVTDTKAETVQLSAKSAGTLVGKVKVGSGAVTTGTQIPLTFTVGPVSLAHSKITVDSPTYVAADGTGQHTVTVLLADEYDNAVANQQVDFTLPSGLDQKTTGLPSGVCGALACPTDSNGQAKIIVTSNYSTASAYYDSVTHRASFNVSAKYNGQTVQNDASPRGDAVQANYEQGGASAAKSTLTMTRASGAHTQVSVDDVPGYDAKVVVKNDAGQLVVGATVVFTLDNGAMFGNNLQEISVETNAQGEAKVTLYSHTLAAGNDTSLRAYLGGVEVGTGSPQHPTFTVGAPFVGQSAENGQPASRVVIDNENEVPADGTSTHKVTIYAVDRYGNILPDVDVRVSQVNSDGSAYTGSDAVAFTSATARTNASGLAELYVKATKSGDYYIKGEVVRDQTVVNPDPTSGWQTAYGSPVKAVFGAGQPSAQDSVLALSTKTGAAKPLVVGSGDANRYLATVTVKDANGNLVPNADVAFAVKDAADANPASGVTYPTTAQANANGVAVIELYSSVSGDFKVHATIGGTDVTGSPATASWKPDVIDASKSTFEVLDRAADPVVSNLTGLPASGDSDWWIVRLTAKDANGNYIDDLDAIKASMEFVNVASQNSGVYFSEIVKVASNADPDAAGPATAVAYPTFIAYARTQKAGEWSLGAQTKAATPVQIGSYVPKRWVPAAIDAGHSGYVLTNDPGVYANGEGTQTATITARDAFGNPIAGQKVRVTNVTAGDSPSKLAISAGGEGATSNETGHVGEYVFTLSSTQARSYDIKAWVRNAADTDWIEIPISSYTTANPQTTSFVAGTCSPAKSVLAVDKTTTVVDTNIAVSITLLDPQGNLCESPTAPTLSLEAGSHGTASAVAGSGGNWTATVTDLVAESFDLSAKIGGTTIGTVKVGSGAAEAGTAIELTFTHGDVDLAHSRLSIDSAEYVAADGSGQHTVTVLLADSHDNPIGGQEVAFALPSGLDQKTSGLPAGVCSASTCSTADDGTAKIVVTSVYNAAYFDTSTHEASFPVGAAYSGQAVQNGDDPRGNSVLANYRQGGASAVDSTLSMERASGSHNPVTVDDVPGYQAKVVVKNDAGQLVSGATVVFNLDNHAVFGNNQSTYTIESNAQGEAIVTLYSHTLAAGSDTTLTATIGGVEVGTGSPQHPTFTVGRPFVGQAAENGDPASRIVVDNSTAIDADGVAAHKVTVYAVDRYGNKLGDVPVRISQVNADGSAYSGDHPVTFAAGTTGVTNAQGAVEFSVTSEVSGTYYVKGEVVQDQTVANPDPVTGWQTAYGSPVAAVFTAGPADPTQSSIDIIEDSVEIPGPAHVVVTLRDAQGNQLPDGRDYTVTLVPEAHHGAAPAQTVALSPDALTVSAAADNGDGTFSGTVTSANFGVGTLSFTITEGAGSAVKSDRYDAVTFTGTPDWGKTASTFTTQSGTAVADGVETRYAKVRLVNAAEEPIPGLPITFTVPADVKAGSVEGSATQTVKVTTGDDGWAQVEYTSTKAGVYSVAASAVVDEQWPTWTGTDQTQQLGRGDIEFVPGPADLVKSTIDITEDSVEVPGPAHVVVTLRDAQGNQLPDGRGYTVTLFGLDGECPTAAACAKLTTAQTTVVGAADAGDGTFTGTIASQLAGYAKVGFKAKAAGEADFTDSDNTDQTLFTALPDWGKSAATFSTQSGAAVADGVQTRYAKVQLLNGQGVPIPGLPITFTVPADVKAGSTAGSATTTVQVVTGADGWAQVEYTSTKAGTYQVAASAVVDSSWPGYTGTVENKALGQGNIQFVAGAVDLVKSTIDIVEASVEVPGPAHVVVTLRDAQGNQLSDSLGYSVVLVAEAYHTCAAGATGCTAPAAGTLLIDPTALTVSAAVDNHDGTFSGTVASNGRGIATMSFTVAPAGGAAVKSDNYDTVEFTAGVDFDKSKATFVTEAGPAIADGVQTRYAKVRIVNANGVPIPGLAVVFTVPAGTSSGTTVGGDGVIVVARTDADGWAMVTYTSTVAGDYQVSASIKTPYTYPDDQQAFDPAHVLGTGTIQFVPGPADATKSTITITPSAVKPGVEATITITLRDAQGNLLGDNNEQIALSVVTGDGLLTADNVVISELVNNHDGTWTAKISGLVEGATAATFSIGGKPSGQQAPLTILPADEAIVDMIAPDRIDLTTMMNESIDFSVLDKVKTTAQPVTFVSIEDGDHGTVEFVAGSATLARNLPEGSVGTLTYTPDEDYVGKDGLTVVVENAQGTQRTIPVYITVKAPKVVVKTGGEAIAATAPWIAGGIGLLGVLVIILAVLSRRRARSEEDSMV